MLEQLKAHVFCGCLELFHHHLTTQNYGSISGIDRSRNLIVMKPAHVAYRDMQISDMIVIDLAGNVIEGTSTPSVDTPAHIELYKNFPEIQSIVHSRSRWATIFAQAGRPIPPFNTLHSNHFLGDIPCTRRLTQNEIESNYQKQIGLSIVETFRKRDPQKTPAVLVQNHGSYTWGESSEQAVKHAQVLEECAMMAWHSITLANGNVTEIPKDIQEWYQQQPRD